MVKCGELCGECGGLADVKLGLKNAPTFSTLFWDGWPSAVGRDGEALRVGRTGNGKSEIQGSFAALRMTTTRGVGGSGVEGA